MKKVDLHRQREWCIRSKSDRYFVGASKNFLRAPTAVLVPIGRGRNPHVL